MTHEQTLSPFTDTSGSRLCAQFFATSAEADPLPSQILKFDQSPMIDTLSRRDPILFRPR